MSKNVDRILRVGAFWVGVDSHRLRRSSTSRSRCADTGCRASTNDRDSCVEGPCCDDDMVDEADKGVDRTIAVCTDPDRWDLLSRGQEHRQQYPSINHA